MRPIRLIVPTTPGGPPDIIARVIGEKIGEAFGQPVIVDNRPGASGAIGLEMLARAPADGHTLGAVGMPFVAITPHLLPRLPYDTAKDFTPITLVAWNYNILAVPSTSPVTSVAQLIATARAKPGVMRYSSGGNGTPAHLTSELLKRETAIDVMHVPYKGAAAAVTAVVAGEADFIVGATGALTPHLSTGRLRALATSAPNRIRAYPDLPTLAELGYPKVVFRDWQAIFAPAGTPAHVIDRLHLAITKATAERSSRQRLDALGMEIAGLGLKETAAQVRADVNQMRRLVHEMKIRFD
ncbi:MAG TPA: tripartite tricarboxylate transporter substrate binding protein [Burkholderiales bacterium]|nr:tripartite tricarboxylate transporter substrate binding protein [Burkholderiales bacterium]